MYLDEWRFDMKRAWDGVGVLLMHNIWKSEYTNWLFLAVMSLGRGTLCSISNKEIRYYISAKVSVPQ